MNRPPLILRLKVSGQRKRCSLWLPLFLVWLVLAAIAIALLPLILIAVAILWPFGWGKLLFFFWPPFLGVLCALRGLEVDVKQGSRIKLISFR